MPERWWVPLRHVTGPVKSTLLHAAFSRWFDDPSFGQSGEVVDASADVRIGHRDNMKPYSISPMSNRVGEWGIEISTLSSEARARFEDRHDTEAPVRLGRTITSLGPRKLLSAQSWGDLAAWDGASRWTITFDSPTCFRSGNRSSPFPVLPAMLRAPTEAWAAFGPAPVPRVTVAEQQMVWVSDLDLQTDLIDVDGRPYRGVVGTMEVRASTEVAARVSALLSLAQFSGVGSFRGKGMGVVSIASG